MIAAKYPNARLYLSCLIPIMYQIGSITSVTA